MFVSRTCLAAVVMTAVMGCAAPAMADSSAMATLAISARVNTSLDMITSGSDRLEPMTLAFAPGEGLQAARQDIVVRTNDVDNDIEIKLQSEENRLVNDKDDTAVPIQLTLGGKVLGMAEGYTLNHSTVINNASQPIPLVVTPQGNTKSLASGEYSGQVNLLLTQQISA